MTKTIRADVMVQYIGFLDLALDNLPYVDHVTPETQGTARGLVRFVRDCLTHAIAQDVEIEP